MDYIRAVFRQKIVDEDDREKRSQSLSNQGSLSTRLLVALAAFVSCRNPFLIRAVFRPLPRLFSQLRFVAIPF